MGSVNRLCIQSASGGQSPPHPHTMYTVLASHDVSHTYIHIAHIHHPLKWLHHVGGVGALAPPLGIVTLIWHSSAHIIRDAGLRQAIAEGSLGARF